jgi:hypothetical protein
MAHCCSIRNFTVPVSLLVGAAAVGGGGDARRTTRTPATAATATITMAPAIQRRRLID